MYNFWNISRNSNQTFTLWIDGDEGRPLSALNESQLMTMLEANKVWEEARESVLKQLAQGDQARVWVLKVGKFSRC